MSGVPLHAFTEQEQMELVFLSDNGHVSMESLRTYTLPRAEFRLSVLEKELSMNAFSFINQQKIRRRIDRLDAALGKLNRFLNPSLVGSPYGGPVREEGGASELGLTKCKYCSELVNDDDRFYRGGACQPCWDKYLALNHEQIGDDRNV